MKQILLILSLVAVLKMNGQVPPSGTYTYKLCYHEWSGCVNTCTVIIQSDTITVYADDDIFVPKGEIIIKGILMQHKSGKWIRSEEHTSELQSRENLVCRLLLEIKR